MSIYTTTIVAIDPNTGELKHYAGPNISAISFSDAQRYCENNGLGYCKVEGLLLAEVPCKKDSDEPDWDNQINYEHPNLN